MINQYQLLIKNIVMKLLKYVTLSILAFSCFSCSKEEDSTLKNDLIKKTVAPAIAGEKIEFAYAIGAQKGQLSSAEVKASIAGAEGTGFELNSWFTARNKMVVNGVTYQAGEDVPVQTVKEASTNGPVSTASFMEKVDQSYINPTVAFGTSQSPIIAATVRYAYVVPAEAKGKSISFTFSSTSSVNDKASYSTPAYPVSKMDMKRLIDMTNQGACYFSIEDMKAYTKEEVAAQGLANKIDFIYIYQDKLNGFDYKHSIVSPGSDPKFIAIAGIVPSGATNKTPMEKHANVRDAQLKGSAPNVYIDDIDFQKLNLNEATDFALNFIKDDGAFMKTANGKYAAYIYVNNVDNNGKMTISIKRYPL